MICRLPSGSGCVAGAAVARPRTVGACTENRRHAIVVVYRQEMFPPPEFGKYNNYVIFVLFVDFVQNDKIHRILSFL